MNTFYKDENDVIYDKHSMDWKISKGKHTGEGLTEISEEEAQVIIDKNLSANSQ